MKMKKSTVSILLAIIMIITSCPVKAANYRTSGNYTVVTGYDTDCDFFGATLNSMMETWLNDPSYDKVTINDSSDKEGCQSQIVFDVSEQNIKYPESAAERQTWICQAIYNYSNLCTAFTAGRIASTTKNGYKIIKKVTLYSPVFANEIRNTTMEYKEKLYSIVNNIPSSITNTTNKLLYLHDQIACMADYDMDAFLNSNTADKCAFGPLGISINGTGVCQSYAILMNHAALSAGIPSIVVLGNNHVWNAVQVNSKWYYIDVTWDDMSKTNNNYIGRVNHKYFLVDHSTMAEDDDSSHAHAIDSNFYNSFGAITDSILDCYPDCVPKSVSSSSRISRNLSYLNGSWYYCDNGSIYSWDGISEYGTKIDTLSEIINCSVFENTLYYAKGDGVYQYVDGINDNKLNDLNSSNITDMVIAGDKLKYVDNDVRKEYSLAVFSTATPTPAVTATPTAEPVATQTPTATAAPTEKPIVTQTPAATATIKPTPTVATTPTARPIVTQMPVATVAPTVTPTMTQAPVATATPTVTPTMTQAPVATATPTVTPTATQAPVATATPIVTQAPSSTDVPTATPTPTVTPAATSTVSPTPITTAIPTITENPTTAPNPQVTSSPKDTPETTVNTNTSKKLKKGSKVTDKNTKAVYEVVSTGKNRTVKYVKSTKKNISTLNIPATVKLKGKTYKITSIGDGAFQNNNKLTLVKIGKNVKTIGNKAFYKCKNLRYILIKSNKLTSTSVGKKAFGSGYSYPRVKTDKSVWKRYYNILMSKGGISKKALFVIDPVKLVI